MREEERKGSGAGKATETSEREGDEAERHGVQCRDNGSTVTVEGLVQDRRHKDGKRKEERAGELTDPFIQKSVPTSAQSVLTVQYCTPLHSGAVAQRASSCLRESFWV